MKFREPLDYYLGLHTLFWSGIFLIAVWGQFRHLNKEVPDPGGLCLGAITGVLAHYGTVELVFRRLVGIGPFLRDIVVSFNDSRPPARRVAVLGVALFTSKQAAPSDKGAFDASDQPTH